jgi:peptidoglycan-associated lipoprotein
VKFASLTLIAFVVTLSIGCKHGPKNITQIPGGGSAVAGNGGLLDTTSGGTVGNGGDVVSVDGDGNIGLAGLDEFENMLMNREAFSAQTVYFGFDRSEVHPDDSSKVGAVADALSQTLQNKILIEGHCDERGTEEYNRALGERRALSVRDFLVELGISADRIRTMSLGEDRPADPGLSEDAFQANRRGEFILLTPKSGN